MLFKTTRSLVFKNHFRTSDQQPVLAPEEFLKNRFSYFTMPAPVPLPNSLPQSDMTLHSEFLRERSFGHRAVAAAAAGVEPSQASTDEPTDLIQAAVVGWRGRGWGMEKPHPELFGPMQFD